jgi:hypothetical protein
MVVDCLIEVEGAAPHTLRDDGQQGDVLLDLIAHLKAREYRFVTPTPATHARVIGKVSRRNAHDLRDMFGWSMPFEAHLLEAGLLRALLKAGWVETASDGLRSRLRVSSLGRDLFLHSAYPTDGTDAVFFGPDSYRFARLIAEELRGRPARQGARLVDVGTGSGIGGIVAARLCRAATVMMTDINPVALRLARINAETAGVRAGFHQTSDLPRVENEFDLVLANPPYIVDPAGRAYRDGGGMHGGEVSLGMARLAVPRLASGGRFILYTGSAIVDGGDELRDRLADLADEQKCALRYEEIDPDVFGEELETEAYSDVDRIALVGAVIERRSGVP